MASDNLERTLPLFTETATPLMILMDGHAMVHRAFHAISVRAPLTVSATGEDITGVFGFTTVFCAGPSRVEPHLLRHCLRYLGPYLSPSEV